MNVIGSASPMTLPVGNASLPVILGRNGTIAIIYAPIMAVLYGFLLFRTTRGFEIRIAGASPDAARYAGHVAQAPDHLDDECVRHARRDGRRDRPARERRTR